MNRRFLLETLLKPQQSPQLSAPTISLSDSILSIEEVENAEYYDIYVDGVLEESVPAVSGMTIYIGITGDYPPGNTPGNDNQTAYSYYSLNEGTDDYISMAHYISYQSINLSSLQQTTLGLTDVEKLEVCAGGGEGRNAIYIYDTTGTLVKTLDWVDGVDYATKVNITEFLQDGYFVVVEADD